MAKPRLSSLLVFGVEWGPVNGVLETAAADRLAGRLLNRFQRRQFKATWALSDMTSAWSGRIQQAGPTQEIALDVASQTPRDPRNGFAFAAQLRDHVHRAEQAGVRLRSLVLDPRGRVPYHALAKLGFRTVRPGRGQSGRFAQLVQPQTLRFGLWGLPVSIHFPQVNRIIQRFSTQQVAYSVRRAAQQKAVLHVVFDLAHLAAQGESALRAVDRLMDVAAALRDQQQIQTARLMDIDHMVRLETAARPTQSILRRSA